MGFHRGPKFDTSYLNNLQRCLRDGGEFSRPDAKDIQADMDKIIELSPTMLLTATSGKTSKLYSQIPTNGEMDFTYTRNSSGSYSDKSRSIKIVSANNPRFQFDYTGSFKGLLIEPAATNLFLRSNEFENNYWIKQGLNISESFIDNPFNESVRMLTTQATGNRRFYTSLTLLANTRYSYSIFTKRGNFNEVRLDFGDNAGPEVRLFVNLASKTATLIRDDFGNASFFINSYKDDWVRIGISWTQLNTRVSTCYFQTINTQENDFVYVYGAQLEVGSVATSYIPTTTNSSSRSTDSAASPLINYNTTEWTIFFDIEYLENFRNQCADVHGSPLVWYFRRQGSTSVNFWNQNAQQNLGSYSFSPANSQKRFKGILSFNGSTVSTFVNGTKTGNAITPTNLTPYLNLFNSNTNRLAFSKLDLGVGQDSQHVVKSAALWDRCLTDAESLNLTTI